MKKIFLFYLILLFSGSLCSLYSADFNPLPDTGQTKCYDDKGNVITCPSPGEDFYGQDANYKGLQQKFTVKEIDGDKVVIDENTGLIWMQRTGDINGDGKISEYDTWYQQGDDSDVLTWQGAVDYCENLNYAGYSDWRLPTLFELSTIVNYGTYNPTIDRTVFECQSSDYWSSTTGAFVPDSAWGIYFYYGDVKGADKSNHYYVRCVRSKLSDNLEIGRFENLLINGDEIVMDNLTGLMWQKSDDNNTITWRTWKEALKYCEDLTLAGYSDWRLPNIQELRSVVKYDTYSPAIDRTVFDWGTSYYWSSTTYAKAPDRAWHVGFYYGYNSWTSKSYTLSVRCVRSGLSGNSDIGSFDECDSTHLDNCKSESECKEAGGYWHDNKCNETPLKWKFKTDGAVWNSFPAIGSDGTIYFGSLDNYFYALNPDGTLKWKFKTNGTIEEGIAIGSDGTIYFGSYDSYLYALNPDGTLKWKFETEDVILCSPTISRDGTVYFGSFDNNFYALNPDGTLK